MSIKLLTHQKTILGETLLLKKSIDARFKKLLIKGNIYQETSKQGKNILDLTKTTKLEQSDGITYEIKNSNEIIVSFSEKTDTRAYYLRLFKALAPKDYYIQCKMEILEGAEATKTQYLQIANRNFLDTSTSITYNNQITTKVTIEEQNNSGVIFGFIVSEIGETSEKTSPRKVRFYDMMISTDDVEFESPIKNCGDMNFKITDNTEQEQSFSFPAKEGQVFHKGDYLADDGTHHKRKTIELDGTENLIVLTDQTGHTETILARLNLNNILYVSNQITYASNAFKAIKQQNWKNDEEMIFAASNRINFSILRSRLESEDNEGVKAFFAKRKEEGKPVIVEYELEEEEIEPYSPEQQEAYDKIKNTAHTYKGVTHIFSEDEVSPEFEATYLQYKTRKFIKNYFNIISN